MQSVITILAQRNLGIESILQLAFGAPVCPSNHDPVPSERRGRDSPSVADSAFILKQQECCLSLARGRRRVVCRYALACSTASRATITWAASVKRMCRLLRSSIAKSCCRLLYSIILIFQDIFESFLLWLNKRLIHLNLQEFRGSLSQLRLQVWT